jgi:hypothetical protein
MLTVVTRRLRRALPIVVLDIHVVLALLYPSTFFYLPWLLRALYLAVSYAMLRDLWTHRWVFQVFRLQQLRVLHGFEHATISVLEEHGVPVAYGHTCGLNRFRVVLDPGNAHRLSDVRVAAKAAIRRVMAGERSLVYHPRCGTSVVVSTAALWLVTLSSGLIALWLGAGMNVALALFVMFANLWGALELQLGLVAQRLFTVSVDFTSARVVDVRLVAGKDEDTFFDIDVDIHAPTEGGWIIPNVG